MDFKNFQHIILKLQVAFRRDHEAYKLGIDLINFTEDYHNVVNLLLKSYYGKEGEDIIGWWLYEDVEKNIYDSETGEVIANLTTIESLWEYVEGIRKSENFQPYVLPETSTNPLSDIDETRLENLFKNLVSNEQNNNL